MVGEKIYALNTDDKDALATLSQQAGKNATVTGTVNGVAVEVSSVAPANRGAVTGSNVCPGPPPNSDPGTSGVRAAIATFSLQPRCNLAGKHASLYRGVRSLQRSGAQPPS